MRNQFEWRLLIGIFILLTLWLGVVYGSWNFFDNPDPTLITIGNSYVRYWLPVFVLSSVFSAYIVTQTYQYCILRSAGRRVRLFLTNVLLALILFVPLLLSVNLVFFGADGIVPTRAALDSFVGKRMGILARTEPNAIIIVDRADKYLFPYRQVIVPLRSDVTYQSLGKISTYAPLYYFGITLPEKDVAYLVKTYLAPQGLTIDLVATMNDESLYRLRPSISL